MIGTALLTATLPAIIGGGAAVAKGVIDNKTNNSIARTQADAAKRAAELEAKATADALAAEREAMDYQRQQAAAQQQARAPYVQSSNASLSKLSELLGVPAPTFAPQGGQGQMPRPQAPPQPQGGTTLSSLFAPQQEPQSMALPTPASPMGAQTATTPYAQGQGVKMVAPTGEVGLVPRDKVNEAIAKGARLVA